MEEKKYNEHYAKYRETILENAKKYYKKKAEEKRKQIALGQNNNGLMTYTTNNDKELKNMYD